MSHTGLLTARCDPYGAESTIKLMGGTVDEKHKGKYNWYCPQRADGRFRFVCKGGDYGMRQANDSGLVKAYHCDGGHKGVVMPLCRKHQQELGAGPPPPGFDSSMRPYGVVGGTKANEMCPACANPPEARPLMERTNVLQQEIAQAQMFMLLGRTAALEAELTVVREQLTILYHTGRIHRCPLQLIGVS